MLPVPLPDPGQVEHAGHRDQAHLTRISGKAAGLGCEEGIEGLALVGAP